MGAKYEVVYWDYEQGREISVEYTNSIIKAFLLLCKLEREWYCVSIKFRRDRVREK